MSDGIEIHYNAERQHLELACESEAFAAYREVARQHLAGFPDINLDRVAEINVVDAAALTRKRTTPRHLVWQVVLAVLLVALLALAAVGAVSLAASIHRKSPNHALQPTAGAFGRKLQSKLDLRPGGG